MLPFSCILSARYVCVVLCVEYGWHVRCIRMSTELTQAGDAVQAKMKIIRKMKISIFVCLNMCYVCMYLHVYLCTERSG